jgi:general secretion pathway protein G
VAGSNASTLVTSLKMFEVDCGPLRAGASVDVLWTRPADVDEGKWKGPYVDNADALIDPWDNKYVLIIPSQHGNADFDVVSYGADGQPGGEDEDADIVKP